MTRSRYMNTSRIKTAFRVLLGKENLDNSNTSLQLENAALRSKVYRLEHTVKKLKADFSDRKNIDLAGFVNDGEPSDQRNRSQYVAEVHYFWEEILEKRLRASIADVREQLAQMQYNGIPSYVPRDAYDWFLRGTENALWLVYDWGKSMSGEHINNMNTDNLEDNKES